jgi:transposase
MDHVAIDLGGRKSQVCVRRADGTIEQETKVFTRQLQDFLQNRPPGRVILETCSEAFAVADQARAAGHEIRVVPATLVRSLGVGQRKTKTDARDARVLSEVSTRIDLPSVHVPALDAREMKSRCGMRDALVAARTQLVNTVRSWKRGQLSEPVVAKPTVLPQRMREAFGGELPAFVERQLVVIEALNEQIRMADREIARLAKADDRSARLMSVPGVGPLTAARFVATIDRIERFESAHKVQAYLGLTPGEDSSSERQRRTSITKAGSTAMRHNLVQAAWAARRSAPDHPLVQWSQQVERRRGKLIAVTALARKLAGILFALWRDGTFYARDHAAQREAASG